MRPRPSTVPLSCTILILFLVALVGCRTAYYATMEKFGKEKRHLLQDKVEATRSEQEKASEEFKDVITRIKEMTGFDGGQLEKMYKKLQSDYEDCEDRAQSVSERIREVETIGADLFKEWESEIQQISNSKLKSQSRSSLRATRNRFQRLNEAMVAAEERMQPVLQNLKDYVLYLKHNLNARAVGALKEEADDIEMEVDALIADIDKSIAEADSFLKAFTE